MYCTAQTYLLLFSLVCVCVRGYCVSEGSLGLQFLLKALEILTYVCLFFGHCFSILAGQLEVDGLLENLKLTSTGRWCRVSGRDVPKRGNLLEAAHLV